MKYAYLEYFWYPFCSVLIGIESKIKARVERRVGREEEP